MAGNQPDRTRAGAGDGMEARVRDFDWSRTALGAMGTWPRSLRCVTNIMLGANQPMFVIAGEQRLLLYNNCFADVLARRHPEALGKPLTRVWPELACELDAEIERAFAGETGRRDGVRLVPRTHGLPEERHFEFALTPVSGDDGRVEAIFCTSFETTPQTLTQERLRETMQMLELAWEAARGAVFEHAVPLEGPTYYSDQWGQILGYRDSELPSYDRFIPWLFERIHPEDRPVVRERYEDFMSGRQPSYRVEVRIRHRDGHWIWIRGVNTALERNEDGSVRRLVGLALDISDLKNSEAALKESEAQFREMANGLPLIIWVHDAEGRLQMVNDTYAEFFGLDREQLYGHQWERLIHPDDADYLGEFQRALRERREYHATARVTRHDGECRRIESWGRPRFGSDGEFRGIVGGSVDVTDRVRAEHALMEEEKRFRTLADNIAQFAWMAHPDGRIFWYNKRWFDYTGMTEKEVEEGVWERVHHPDHRQRVITKFLECFRNGEPWEDTFPLLGKDGQYRWFLSRAQPIRNDAGEVVMWFGTNTDITEQRDYAERLQESERQMSEFLAMLGHELRNPLAAVRSAAELVNLAEPEDPRLRRAWAVLERQSTHMTRLIDSLLEISRIARGKITLDRKPVDLRQVVEGVLQDRSAQLASSGLELRRDLPPEPVYVSGDDVRLAQIFDNLISNALKFTDSPGVISVSLEAREGRAVARVSDTGAGIRPEMLTSIFEPFLQEAQDISRSVGGLGLGLALVKRLVTLHDGEVEAHSEGPGQGAEFVVRLPLAEQPQHGDRSAGAGEQASRRVLIVEDNDDAADMLQLVLEMQGHSVSVAATGGDAMEKLHREHVDIVLCDIGLPDMSGYELADAVRKDPRLCDLPLVALTGYGRSSDRKRTQEAGFNAHLTKPVELDVLVEVLSELPEASSTVDPRL
ncbi:MAG: PAS domain S-box protein [Pseudomonadota bacterium]